MRFSIYICVLLIVQFIPNISGGSCKNNVEYVDVVVNMNSIGYNEHSSLLLKNVDPNDSTVTICNEFDNSVVGNFMVITGVKNKKLEGMVKLLLFKEEKDDLDDKKRVSYLVFFMDSFQREGQNKHQTMELVKFEHIKLFIEDEKDNSKYVLNPECAEVFRSLINKNRNRLFKNETYDNNVFYVCTCDGKHSHKQAAGDKENHKIFRIPKKLIEEIK